MNAYTMRRGAGNTQTMSFECDVNRCPSLLLRHVSQRPASEEGFFVGSHFWAVRVACVGDLCCMPGWLGVGK